MTVKRIHLLIDWYRPPVRVRTGSHYLLWISCGHRAQAQVCLVKRWRGWRYFNAPYRWRLEAGWLTIMVCQ